MKMNNRILAIVFFVLLALFLFQKFVNKPKQRSFRDTIVEIDTLKIDKLKLINKGNPAITLQKENGNWEMVTDEGSFDVKNASVFPFLQALSGLEAGQLVSRSSDKWEDYELTDETASILEAYKGGKKMAELYVGRFSFDQASRTAKSYVRRGDEEDIYSVDGFLSMSFDRKPDDFRNKDLFNNMSIDSIQSIRLNGADRDDNLEKGIAGEWIDDEGQLADSAAVATYLQKLSQLRGSKFYTSTDNSLQQIARMELVDRNDAAAYIMGIYSRSDTSGQFVIRNERNVLQSFESDSSGIFQQAYLDFLKLMNSN